MTVETITPNPAPPEIQVVITLTKHEAQAIHTLVANLRSIGNDRWLEVDTAARDHFATIYKVTNDLWSDLDTNGVEPL